MTYYDEVVERGYAAFDNQSECEDFMCWAINEIKILRQSNKELVDLIYN
jgi:hypothetical protein